MAGIIYDLVNILKEQKECYEGLVTLATYKTEGVANKTLELITQVVEKEEEFIGRLNILEKRRETTLKDIALVTGMDYSQMTVTKIIDKMGMELEVSKELIEVKKDILDAIKRLEEQNKLNKLLIDQSLEFVNFSVNALQSAQTGVSNANYGRPGQDMSLETQSFFDKKQ